MPRIVLVDSYYPDFIDTLPVISYGQPRSYEDELATVLSYEFGTGSAYGHYLRANGIDVTDIIANHSGLQHKWAHDHGASGTLQEILLAQIAYYKPDILFFQDLSFLPASTLEQLRSQYIVTGQCSCPLPDVQNVRQFHCLWTSFPHYVRRFEELGVRAIYSPLAFDQRHAFERVQPAREYDITFVGGVGRDSHWLAGTDLLELVATAFPYNFHWWGYGMERLSGTSRLARCYRGQAWGNAMYSIYRRSKIVINRHGEVAEQYANNMRMYEATGCGALLVTEDRPNLWDLFNAREVYGYLTPQDAIAKMRYYLDHDNIRRWVAKCGQERTLRDHTYAKRMKTVSDHLKGILCLA